MKILSNQRKGFLNKRQIGQYLIYASGEIILVIIGILLGLSLNKWNEGRIQLDTLENDLTVILEDLRKDTLEVRRIIDYHLDVEEKMKLIIKGELEKDSLLACPACLSALISLQPFYMEKQGYQLLQKYEENTVLKEDSLVTNIIQFYGNTLEKQKLNLDLLTSNLERNLIEWQENYPWFTEVLGKGQFDHPEFVNYLLNDPIYKNRMTYQMILNYRNYVPFLQEFNKTATKLMQEIKARLIRAD
ncbi:MAG: hypothetical protein AAF696_30545 [Bacteroidota bacterium]